MHRHARARLPVAPQAHPDRLAQRQQHLPPVIHLRHVARCGEGVSVALVGLRLLPDKSGVAPVGKLPDDLALLSQTAPQECRVGVRQLANRANAHQLQSFFRRTADHEQLPHRQRPELRRDLRRKKRMRFVRLFKIPRHFRQQLVAGNADVDREAKLSVNALPQPVRRQHRRAVKSRRTGHVDPRLVDGKLLHKR